MLSQMENTESCGKARANHCRNPVVVRRLRRRYHITPMKGDKARRGPLTIKNINSSIPVLLPPSPPLKPITNPTVRHVTETPPQSTEPTTQRLRLPRVLAKPALREVDIQAIEDAYPELQGVTAEYIREHLPLAGVEMLAATRHINSRPATSALPKELEIVMNHVVAAACPTHMFAVYGSQPSPWQQQQQPKRKVTLFAAHHLVFAANCAHLPVLDLQPLVFSSDEESTQTMTVPVIPLCLPSPETFPLLQAYLYTKQPQVLTNALASLPQAPSSPETVTISTQQAILVHGLWKNGCALGIVDDVFWKTVQSLWAGVLKTFGSGVGGKAVQVPL